MPENGDPAASRRQFFRVFSRQTVAGAGSILGTVNEIRQTGATAAGQLLGLTELSDEPAEISVAAAFRSPYRFTGDALLIVDQRGLPEVATVIECRSADAAASAVRAGVAGSGPVLGQIAAYALELAVAANGSRPTAERRAALNLAAGTLRAARFQQRALRSALERMEAVDARLPDDLPADDHLSALHAEAEAIATDAALDHGQLGQVGAELLAELAARADRPSQSLSLLVHGEGGAMSAGLVGTSFAVIDALSATGKDTHVWLTEGAPTMEGARISAWQLAANDVPHTIVADTAVGWLLHARRVDAVLLRADWVCANGDMAAPLGSLSVATLAANAEVPVYACVPTSVVDPSTGSGDAIPTELRAPVEGRRGPRLDPAADIVPGDLMTGYITAAGIRTSADVASPVGG